MAESSGSADGPRNMRNAGTVTGDTIGQGTRLRKAWGWLDDRLGLSALRYKVPEHANTIWYTLGGITFMGLLIATASGI